MENPKKVWIVFNVGRLHTHPPRVTCGSLFDARQEAERLAKEHPGYTFHVMASVECHFKKDVDCLRFDADAEYAGDGVPF